MSNYNIITLQDIVDFVNNNKEHFPDGMKTKVFSGDFEGNYTHWMHEISSDTLGDDRVIFLGYEMHEDCGK